MNHVKDMTIDRKMVKQTMQINDVQFAQLMRVKGMVPKIINLINTLKNQQKKINQLEAKVVEKAQKIPIKTSVAMIDPITKETIKEFVCMSEATEHFGYPVKKLSEYFNIYDGLGLWMGYEWKKIPRLKRCVDCKKIDKLTAFPRSGIVGDRVKYKSYCLSCWAKKNRKGNK